jgi:hypothetical protein
MPAIPTLRPCLIRNVGCESDVALRAVAGDPKRHRRAGPGIGLRRNFRGRAHGFAVDRDDPVAGAKSGARPRFVGKRFVDQRRAEIAAKAEHRHEIAFPIGAVERRKGDGALRSRAVRALDVDRDVASARGAQETPAQILPALDRDAADGDDQVAFADARHRHRRFRGRLGQERALRGNTGHVGAGKEQDREQEVGDGPRGNDGNPLADRLPVECARKIGRRHRTFAFIEHLHVAAERNRRHRPLRAIGAYLPRPHDAAEADGEAQHLHLAPARHRVMAELMEHDEDAEHHKKSDELGDGVHHAASGSLSQARVTARASASAARASSSACTGRTGNRASASEHAGAMSV